MSVSLAKAVSPARVTLAKTPKVVPDSWSLILDGNNLEDFALFLTMRPAVS